MEEQIKPEDQDVEAHKKPKLKATDDAPEGGSEDFELHRRRAADEGGEASDDDVELHRMKTRK